MSAFNWSGQYRAIAPFCNWIRQQPRYSWIRGVTLHHTDVPSLAQWAGQVSVNGLERYYRETKRWSGGPHLFVASGTAARGLYDGVWQGTQLDRQGVHAGDCNEHYLGLEFVGNYEAHPPTTAQKSDLFLVLDAIFDWLGLPVDINTLKGHRECMLERTCPGSAIDLNLLRAELRVMRSGQPAPIAYQVAYDGCRFRKNPRLNSPITRQHNTGFQVQVMRVNVIGDQVALYGISDNKWAQTVEGDFIWQHLLRGDP